MPETRPAPSQSSAAEAERSSQDVSSAIGIDVSALSHPGRVRPNNEDQFFVSKQTRSLETMLSSLPAGDLPERVDDFTYLMIVADGMGGHAAGEVASRMAISSVIRLTLDIPDWFWKVDEEHAPEIEGRARGVVQQVDSMLCERGRQDPGLRGMGSTLTAARTLGRDLLIVHVGDSRAYLYRDGGLHRLTRDHTYAQLLVDTGQLAPSDVEASGVRHILTNVLGGSTEHVDVNVDWLRLEDQDRLLLCSDGLTDRVDDDTIATTLSRAEASSDACSRLVQLALEAGGRDNVTVIVAAFTVPALPDARSPQHQSHGG